MKYLVTLAILLIVTHFFGRAVAFCLLGLCLVPILYIHGVLLPRKGINGWTGEPKRKYYEFRGWDIHIFGPEADEING